MKNRRVLFILGAIHGAKVAGTLDELKKEPLELPRKRGKETIHRILISRARESAREDARSRTEERAPSIDVDVNVLP